MRRTSPLPDRRWSVSRAVVSSPCDPSHPAAAGPDAAGLTTSSLGGPDPSRMPGPSAAYATRSRVGPQVEVLDLPASDAYFVEDGSGGASWDRHACRGALPPGRGRPIVQARPAPPADAARGNRDADGGDVVAGRTVHHRPPRRTTRGANARAAPRGARLSFRTVPVAADCTSVQRQLALGPRDPAREQRLADQPELRPFRHLLVDAAEEPACKPPPAGERHAARPCRVPELQLDGPGSGRRVDLTEARKMVGGLTCMCWL
jgi:hypothetical protein